MAGSDRVKTRKCRYEKSLEERPCSGSIKFVLLRRCGVIVSLGYSGVLPPSRYTSLTLTLTKNSRKNGPHVVS